MGRMRRTLGISLGLVGLIFVAYHGVADHQFIRYNDPQYITRNADVLAGLTWSGVRWAFTNTSHGGYGQPLTWLSHMLDVQCFGLNAGPHHLVSAAWHAINAALLFTLLFRLTAAPWRSGMVAALFALHPIAVESVAWASERHTVLGAAFMFLTLHAYVGYVRRLGAWRYALVCALTALTLMANPALVTLPCAMVLLDIWPLRRLRASEPGRVGPDTPEVERPPHPEVSGPTRPGSLILEKLPLLLLSIGSGVLAIYGKAAQGTVAGMTELPVGARMANVVVGYVRYLWHAVYPVDLSIYYPHPTLIGLNWLPWQVIGALVLLIAATVGAMISWRSRPYLLICWLWFLGMLAPMVGFLQTGGAAMADHHAYLAFIGLYIAAVWAAVECLSPKLLRRVAPLVIVVLTWLSYLQAGWWQSNLYIFWYALQSNEINPLAHNMIARELLARGQAMAANDHARRAVEIQPNAMSHNNMGAVYSSIGEYKRAEIHFRSAIARRPDQPGVWRNLARALGEQGKLQDAVAAAQRALELDADAPLTLNLLGELHLAMRRTDEAIAAFEHALQLVPDNATVRRNLQRARSPSPQETEHDTIEHPVPVRGPAADVSRDR